MLSIGVTHPPPILFLKKQKPLIILGNGVNQLSRPTTAALLSPTQLGGVLHKVLFYETNIVFKNSAG
jgi:hypothetical protein